MKNPDMIMERVIENKKHLVEKKDSSEWKNRDNNAFYAEIKAEGLEKIALKAGLLSGCDVRALKPYWKDACHILDVGSGFGRVISALLDEAFQGEITAVERNAELFAHLMEHFQEKVTVIRRDINTLSSVQQRFDVVLFLWSGLADFSREEQPAVVASLAGLLKEGGYLVIDTMPMDVTPLDTEQFEQQSFLTRAETSVVHTYEPSSHEIKAYGEGSGLDEPHLIRCKTDTDRERWLYVFKK